MPAQHHTPPQQHFGFGLRAGTERRPANGADPDGLRSAVGPRIKACRALKAKCPIHCSSLRGHRCPP
eukprot:jgi/Tetstr1/421028/TSEL_012073.t1